MPNGLCIYLRVTTALPGQVPEPLTPCRSKYGALSLLCLTVIASIVCAFVKVKYAIIHYWHRICAWVFRWIFFNKGKADKEMDNYFAATRIRNEKANYYHDDNDDDGGPTEHDLHVSQDM